MGRPGAPEARHYKRREPCVFAPGNGTISAMSLPPEIQRRLQVQGGDVQVSVKASQGERAVIEGKTNIPFASFVKLVLKRKVQTLFRDFEEEPIILSSTLLTHLASTPEESREDRSALILTALVIGLCLGMFLMATAIVVLETVGFPIGRRELLAGLGVLLAVGLAVFAAMKIQTHRMKQELVTKVEEVARLFSK